jgi:hypothetical protein
MQKSSIASNQTDLQTLAFQVSVYRFSELSIPLERDRIDTYSMLQEVGSGSVDAADGGVLGLGKKMWSHALSGGWHRKTSPVLVRAEGEVLGWDETEEACL